MTKKKTQKSKKELGIKPLHKPNMFVTNAMFTIYMTATTMMAIRGLIEPLWIFIYYMLMTNMWIGSLAYFDGMYKTNKRHFTMLSAFNRTIKRINKGEILHSDFNKEFKTEIELGKYYK